MSTDKIKSFVKSHRQRSLTFGEKLDILWMQATLREAKATQVSAQIAQNLGRSERTVKSVLAEFLATGKVTVCDPSSNTTNHKSRVPDTRAVRALVRRFIRDRSVTRTRTVAKDVLAMLVDEKVLSVNESNTKDYSACLRSVQAFLLKQGYGRGKRGKTTYRMSKAHELPRDNYVNFMVPTVSNAPRRPVVYLDESFIHNHYCRYEDSLYDPTMEGETKRKNKGRRYCFIAGIINDGTDVSHLLGLDIFVGGKKNGKVVKDYHSIFNHDYFVIWFGNLMDEVEELGWSSAVFVRDNASYHKGKPSNTPKGNWKKEALVQACAEYNIDDISPNDLKATIWARLKQHIDQNVAPVVADMARARGHHVVY
ncbi:hypothetical protein As57867_005412, partial [Aphanomyces stellatus]